MLLETILKQPATKVDTVTIVKTDTVKIYADASFELMSKIDNFYNNSWNSLLWVVGALLAIIGIVIPLIIQYYQRRQFVFEKEELKEKFEENKIALNKLSNEVAERVQNVVNELNNQQKIALEAIKSEYDEKISTEIKKFNISSQAILYHLQALISYGKGDVLSATKDAVAALTWSLKGEDDEIINTLFDNSLKGFSEIKKADLITFPFDFADAIAKVGSVSGDMYKDKFEILKKAFENIA